MIFNNHMQKAVKVLLTALLLFVTLIFLYLFFFKPKRIDITNNKHIYYGRGWKNYTSNYSGSEFSFSFRKSRDISFELVSNSKADQVVQIFIDQKEYTLSSNDLTDQTLTIKTDPNKPHTVMARHTCSRLYFPCQVKIRKISVDNTSQLYNYQYHSKLLSVLGDSISTIYGKDNYTQIAADQMGYELHNASVLESTVSKVNRIDSAIKRYERDLYGFNSDAIVIFMGTNDAGNHAPLDQFYRDYSRIVKDLEKENSDTKIILLGLLPRQDAINETLEDYDNQIKNIADENKLIYIDTANWLVPNDFSDKIHPSFEAQKKIAQKLVDSLTTTLKN